MDVKDYCRSIEVELNGWKAKMYDTARKVNKSRGSAKEDVQSQVEDLHKHIEVWSASSINRRRNARLNSVRRKEKLKQHPLK